MSLISFDKKIKDYCKKDQISGILRITVKGEIKYRASFGKPTNF